MSEPVRLYTRAEREAGISTPVLTDEPGWDSRAYQQNQAQSRSVARMIIAEADDAS